MMMIWFQKSSKKKIKSFLPTSIKEIEEMRKKPLWKWKRERERERNNNKTDANNWNDLCWKGYYRSIEMELTKIIT